MVIVGRILGAFNVLAAAVVCVNVLSGHAQLWNAGALWDYINPMMAAAVVISLLVNLRRKISLLDDDRVSRTYLEVKLLFYASIILTMIFFSNWFFMLWDFLRRVGRVEDAALHLLVVHQPVFRLGVGHHGLPPVAQGVEVLGAADVEIQLKSPMEG